MLQFFETRIGRDFLHRVVAALETIARRHESNLQERVEVLELALNLPSRATITCKDGFSFILGIKKSGTNLYYLSFPTQKDSLIEQYRDNPASVEAVAYSGVPATTVAQLIINHGGLAGSATSV